MHLGGSSLDGDVGVSCLPFTLSANSEYSSSLKKIPKPSSLHSQKKKAQRKGNWSGLTGQESYELGEARPLACDRRGHAASPGQTLASPWPWVSWEERQEVS